VAHFIQPINIGMLFNKYFLGRFYCWTKCAML